LLVSFDVMSRRGTRALVSSVLALVVLAGAVAVASKSATPPLPRAADFSARVDNPWYPLIPGTTYVYRGAKDGHPSREVLTVTHRTKLITGVPCVVIEDRLYLSGYLEERTTEWYSQDKQGNVWYFGENTAELGKDGHVTSTSGAWQAGVNGAKPGLFMFAHPEIGEIAQQEFYKGQAADHFRVLSLHASATTPYTTSANAMLTEEWTPLEPGVLDHKLYVRGIGTVLEQTVKGGSERAALVSFKKPK
jgi:hypothetical protein